MQTYHHQYCSFTKSYDCTHVQHAFRRGNISNICYAESVGLALLKGTLQQIGIFEYVSLELRIRSSPPKLRKQFGLAHDTQKRLGLH